jgi:hypothetical protein
MAQGSGKKPAPKNSSASSALTNDLTNLMDLEAPPPPVLAPGDTPLETVMPKIETIDEFSTLGELGMMDHPEVIEPLATTATEHNEPVPSITANSTVNFTVVSTVESLVPEAIETAVAETVAIDSNAFSLSPDATTAVTNEPTLAFDQNVEESFTPTITQNVDPAADLLTQLTVEATSEAMPESALEPIATENFDKLRNYSESLLNQTDPKNLQHPFHFYAEGKFTFFERDKLLRFITENPIGISSSELDLQLSAGRVFFSRISEYAGIRLIQELRDSRLSFRLVPSDREKDDLRSDTPAIRIQEAPEGKKSKTVETQIPVIHGATAQRAQYEEFDSVQMIQFLKAEMIEVEKSELLQEVVDRMTEAIKQKARLKYAAAISQPEVTLTPLRLPSHYQVQVRAMLLKLKDSTPTQPNLVPRIHS